MEKTKARLIAIYLPQFHTTPENDLWWGKGFTEWTNVKKAKPLFKSHYQPIIPAELGYYNLLDPLVREAQAKLAREHGIEGFFYWHYWFSGKKMLEKPFEAVLKSGKPDFPFCLGWVNSSWTGEWKGKPNQTLIKQEYPGEEDHKKHFEYLLPAFKDKRYITVDGKPLFFIAEPSIIPQTRKFTDYWRDLAKKAGLKGLHLVGHGLNEQRCKELGYDSYCDHGPHWKLMAHRFMTSFTGITILNTFKKIVNKPTIYDYSTIVKKAYNVHHDITDPKFYPLLIPNWDNTSRVGSRGVVFKNSTPENFRKEVKKVIEAVSSTPFDKRIIFVKSWNEWAEGNYLEPDIKFGKGFLESIKKENMI